jgi:hypothetical protein
MLMTRRSDAARTPRHASQMRKVPRGGPSAHSSVGEQKTIFTFDVRKMGKGSED